MAEPAFVSAGTYLSGSGSSAAVPVPPGTAAGMLVVVVMFLDGPALSEGPTTPAGFAPAPGTPVQIPSGGGAHSLYVWYKRLSGSDSGTYDVTWSDSRFREAQATLWDGVVASGSPWDPDVDSATDLANGTVTPPVAITTSGPDRRLIHAATCWAGGTWTPPAGFEKRMQGGVGLVTLADRSWPAAGPTGDITAQVTGSDKRIAWLGAIYGPAAAVPAELDDAATAGDDLAVQAATTAGDAAAAAGTLAVTVTAAAQDAGGGAEAAAVAVAVPLADAGGAGDELATSASVEVSPGDGGTGAEALAVSAAAPLADAGGAADEAGAVRLADLADAASGADMLAAAAAAAPLAEAGASVDTLWVAGPQPQGGVMADRVRRGAQASLRDRLGPHMASRVRAGVTMEGR